MDSEKPSKMGEAKVASRGVSCMDHNLKAGMKKAFTGDSKGWASKFVNRAHAKAFRKYHSAGWELEKKEAITMTRNIGGRDIKQVTSYTMSTLSVKQAKVSPDKFTLPKGYTLMGTQMPLGKLPKPAPLRKTK